MQHVLMMPLSYVSLSEQMSDCNRAFFTADILGSIFVNPTAVPNALFESAPGTHSDMGWDEIECIIIHYR